MKLFQESKVGFYEMLDRPAYLKKVMRVTNSPGGNQQFDPLCEMYCARCQSEGTLKDRFAIFLAMVNHSGFQKVLRSRRVACFSSHLPDVNAKRSVQEW